MKEGRVRQMKRRVTRAQRQWHRIRQVSPTSFPSRMGRGLGKRSVCVCVCVCMCMCVISTGEKGEESNN